MRELILAVEPGIGCTTLGLYRGLRPIAHHVERHEGGSGEQRIELAARARAARQFLQQTGVAGEELAAVVGPGGALRRAESGTYVIDDAMLRDIVDVGLAAHPENLGAPLAKAIADDQGCPAFVVDPISIDELEPAALATRGASDNAPVFREALHMRAAARHHASAVQRAIDEMRLVVAHLGVETSLCAIREARLVELVPPGAAEALPEGHRDLALRADRGDGRAIQLLDAKAFQVAKHIGELAVALGGEVDAVLLTGSAAGITAIVNGVCRRVEWIAPVFVYPGDDELGALVEGALRVLSGEEQPKRYG